MILLGPQINYMPSKSHVIVLMTVSYSSFCNFSGVGNYQGRQSAVGGVGESGFILSKYNLQLAMRILFSSLKISQTECGVSE